MPIAPRSSSSADRRPVLVAALSGRALAAAARRAGDHVAVLDLFADDDTARRAERCVRLAPAGPGFDRAALLAAVDALAPAARGLVYGTGFEHDPPLLAAIAARVTLLGNAPETVAAVKDPLGFARLLRRLGLPHPETRLAAPSAAEGSWLRKVTGGSGGGHIVPAGGAAATPGCYFQRRVAGSPLSALFVANGRDARVLGFSEQWVDATAGTPFRYGGCAGPVRPPRRMAEAIGAACAALTAATGLVGVNALDLLVEGERFHILEVNPRPGATLDVFDGEHAPLWRLHLDAVAGRLPARVPQMNGVRAAAIVYAPAALSLPRDWIWPRWTADRGSPGSAMVRAAPICTVLAAAASVPAARAQLARRSAALLARLGVGTAAAA